MGVGVALISQAIGAVYPLPPHRGVVMGAIHLMGVLMDSLSLT